MARNVNGGHIHLPQIVRLLRQQLEQPCGLVQLSRTRPRPLQQSVIAHNDVRLAVLHRGSGATAHHGDPFVSVPRILSRHRHHGFCHLVGDRLRLRTRLPSQARVALGTVPTAWGNAHPFQHLDAPRWQYGFDRGALFRDHTARLRVQGDWPESFFKTRLAIVSSPMTWSRFSICRWSSATCRSWALAPLRVPAVSAASPAARKSSRHRYSVGSDTP